MIQGGPCKEGEIEYSHLKGTRMPADVGKQSNGQPAPSALEAGLRPVSLAPPM